jgi:hypothetical protein
MMLPKVAGGAAAAVAIAFSTLLVGFVVAPTSTPALTARDAPTTASTDNTPKGATDGVARGPIPRSIPGVGIIPQTGF